MKCYSNIIVGDYGVCIMEVHFLIGIILWNCYIYNAVISATFVTWELASGLIRIGEPMTLTCTVHGVEKLDMAVIRQWSKSSSLICYNGKPNDRSKYKELLNTRNQFSLMVMNVTDSDLNCNYQCRYDFEMYTRKLEVDAYNFEHLPMGNSTEIMFRKTAYFDFILDLHLKKVFPFPNCTFEMKGRIMELEVQHYEKHGIYYDVSLTHKSTTVPECSEDTKLVCKLVTDHHIPVKTIPSCRHGKKVESYITMSTALSIIGAVLVSLTLMIFLKRHRHKRRSKHEQKVQKEENPPELHSFVQEAENNVMHQRHRELNEEVM